MSWQKGSPMQWPVVALIGVVVICASSLIGLIGCAQVHVKRLTPDDITSEGVRFYAPQPYLLVTLQPATGGSGSPTLQAQVLLLPKINEQYAITVTPGWGTVNGNVTLKDGWMFTTLSAQMESKGPETINAIAGLITAAGGIKSAEALGVSSLPKMEQVLAPGLYRIDFDPATGYVRGLVPVALVK